MHGRDFVDDAGNGEGVVRPSPQLALEREPPGDRLINVGVFVWLNLAVRHAGAGEDCDGVANGQIEPYEYTDIDQTVAGGLSLKGKLWGRPDDTFAIAGIVNDISGVHQAYLDSGGLGILVGDGMLPNAGREKIIETYYSFPVFSWRMTLDYQFIANPAYNRDRGPVSVIGTRLHTQF